MVKTSWDVTGPNTSVCIGIIALVRSFQLKARLHTLLQHHQDLFSKELGQMHSYTATVHVQSDATPRFFKPRLLPFSLTNAIGQELNRLEQQGLTLATHSKWAAPIILFPKKDGVLDVYSNVPIYLTIKAVGTGTARAAPLSLPFFCSE